MTDVKSTRAYVHHVAHNSHSEHKCRADHTQYRDRENELGGKPSRRPALADRLAVHIVHSVIPSGEPRMTSERASSPAVSLSLMRLFPFGVSGAVTRWWTSQPARHFVAQTR